MDERREVRHKAVTMDSISAPDTEKMKVLTDPKFNANANNMRADEIFSGDRIKIKGEFDRATKVYSDPTRHKEDEEEEEPFGDFSAEPVKKNEEVKTKALDKGVKVSKGYVKKKTIVMWICLMAAVLIAFMLVFPPIVADNLDTSVVLKDRNVFEKMGMTELKTYAMTNYSVWSENAFASEKKENYRIVQIGFSITNPSPFEVTIPQYEVSHVDSKYTDKICYVTAVNTNDQGVVTGDIVSAFGSAEVTVEVVVNVTDMNDEQFNDAVTSMIISTKGMKRKIAKQTYLPCIPAYMPVSNAIYVDLDLK